jgi:hypothetical protein
LGIVHVDTDTDGPGLAFCPALGSLVLAATLDEHGGDVIGEDGLVVIVS